MVKYTASEECISAEDARLIVDALNEYIINHRSAYGEHIKRTMKAKDAISRVLDHASLIHDDICFIVDAGTRNIPK